MEQPESKTIPENKNLGKDPAKASNPLRIIIAAVFIAAALLWGGKTIYHSFLYVETDNAQIEGDVYPVISRIPGKVQDVLASDNQQVHKGDTLIRLEAADYEVRRDIAAAAVESARAGLKATTEQANASSASANAAAATSRKQQADLHRGENLRNQDVISQAEFDGVKAGAQAASAQYTAAGNQYQASLAQIPLQKAEVKKREAELRNAELIAKSQDGGELPDLDVLEDEIRKRDRADAEREHAPLKKHSEAHEIDTSDLTIERQVDIVYNLALDIQKDCR